MNKIKLTKYETLNYYFIQLYNCEFIKVWNYSCEVYDFYRYICPLDNAIVDASLDYSKGYIEIVLNKKLDNKQKRIEIDNIFELYYQLAQDYANKTVEKIYRIN